MKKVLSLDRTEEENLREVVEMEKNDELSQGFEKGMEHAKKRKKRVRRRLWRRRD